MANTVISAGIDVSKEKLDVALLFSDRSKISGIFENNLRGIEKIISLLKKHETAKTVPCVIEATGDYHLLSAIMITQEGFLVNCINPLITKKYQRSSIRDAKTDPIDAKRLAEIGILEKDLPVFSAKKNGILAGKLLSLLSCLEKNKQSIKANVRQLKETQQKLGLSAVDLSSLDDSLDLMEKTKQCLEKTVVECMYNEKLLEFSKMKGLSFEKVATLSAVFDSRYFTNRDQLASFIGIDIRLRRSGKWKGKEKLSKRGNPYARKLVFQIAWGLKTHNDYFKELYRKNFFDNEKSYRESILVIARKFLRMYYSQYLKKYSSI